MERRRREEGEGEGEVYVVSCCCLSKVVCWFVIVVLLVMWLFAGFKKATSLIVHKLHRRVFMSITALMNSKKIRPASNYEHYGLY